MVIWCILSFWATLNAPYTTSSHPAVRSFSWQQNRPPGFPISFEMFTLHQQPARFLTVNNNRLTVLQTLVAEKQPPLTLTHLQQNDQYLNSPYVAVLHRKTTEP